MLDRPMLALMASVGVGDVTLGYDPGAALASSGGGTRATRVRDMEE